MCSKIGVVGTPDQVCLIVPVLNSLQFKITALWCKNLETCRKLSEKFHIPCAAANFKEVLLHQDVDLVYVATEPGMHAEVAVKALTSGKHCICQKPPSSRQSEAQKMVSLSRYYNQLMSLLDSYMRFLPAVTKMRDLIASGYCGKLLVVEARVTMGSLIQQESYSWKCDPSMGGGVVNMLGSHLIDLVAFVSKQQAKKVHGTLSTFRPHTENIQGYRTITSDDFCCFQMQCTEGLSATITLNTHAPGQYQFEFSVTGSNGRLALKGVDLFGNRNGEEESLLYKQDTEGCKMEDFGASLGVRFPATYHRQIVVGNQVMFTSLRSVLESRQPVRSASSGSGKGERGEKPRVQSPPPAQMANIPGPSATFEDGLYIRTVLDAIHTSSTTGQWVDIPKASLVEMNNDNPFWTSSTAEPSPKTHRPVYV